jgi:hypothetical protein
MQKSLLEKTISLRELQRRVILEEALSLVAELWPKPGSATIHVETHQWQRLRRVLLAVPDLIDASDES